MLTYLYILQRSTIALARLTKKVKTVEILSTCLCIKTSKHSKYRIFIHRYQTTYNVQSNSATTPKGITLAAASQV